MAGIKKVYDDLIIIDLYFPDLLSVNFDTSWKIHEDRWLLFHGKVPDRTSSVSGFLYTMV